MLLHQHIYSSLADFIATMDAEKVLAFHAPEAVQQHVEQLLSRKQRDALSASEQDELDHYYILEHIVRLAKSKARLRIQTGLA